MHVIFALDDASQRGSYAHAAHNLLMSMGAKALVGSYLMDAAVPGEDRVTVLERSYIMAEAPFETHIRNSSLVAEQESFLYVTECNKQYAALRYSDGRPDKPLGCLKQVSEEEAKAEGQWTYDPATQRYFIAVENSQSEAPAEKDARELWYAIEDMLYAQEHGSIQACDNAAVRLRAVRDKQKPKWIK